MSRTVRASIALAIVGASIALSACGSLEGNIALGIVGATVGGGRSASSEIEQIYYVGVFDPQDQLPPQVYRIRVHGQASLISTTRFASGWVPAQLVDSLATSIRFSEDTGRVSIQPASTADSAAIQTGRKLIMFGPEGFREAPAGHRLVVVMGANPKAFFSAIDEALGTVSEAAATQRNDALAKNLLAALIKLQAEDELLAALSNDLAAEAPR